MQDFKFDVKVTLVPLKGQNQFPDDVAPGDKEGSGSFSVGNNQVIQANSLLFADSLTTGVKQVAQQTAAIPATPFQVTPTHAANFVIDLGVYNLSTGQVMTHISGTPAAGQYAVNSSTGVYTFASADNVSGYSVRITYAWNDTAVGNTLQVNNQLMGYGPIVEIWFSETYQSPSGNPNGIHIYQARIGSCKMDAKRDGYLIPEYDFQCFANSAGNVFEMMQTAP